MLSHHSPDADDTKSEQKARGAAADHIAAVRCNILRQDIQKGRQGQRNAKGDKKPPRLVIQGRQVTDYGAKRNPNQHSCAAVAERGRPIKDSRSVPAAKTSTTGRKHGRSTIATALEDTQGDDDTDDEGYGIHRLMQRFPTGC